MADITVVSEEEFDAAVADSDNVLALFTAPAWCIPCRRFEPHWEKAKGILTEYTFLKIDLGEAPADVLDHWSYDKFAILSVPTVKILRDGGWEDISARAVVPFVKEVRGG